MESGLNFRIGDIVLRKGGGAESEMRRSAVLAAGGFSHQNT